MLTDKTLKLIVEYENYRFPVGHVHKFVNGFGEEYTTYDVWEEQGRFSEAEWFFVEEGVGLSNEEAISLEVVLSSGTNPEAFEVVSEFIQYVVNTPFFWEHSDSCVQMIGHKYFIDGMSKEAFTPNDRKVITEWFEREEGKIAFFKQHFDELRFKKIIPMYIQWLRELL